MRERAVWEATHFSQPVSVTRHALLRANTRLRGVSPIAATEEGLVCRFLKDAEKCPWFYLGFKKGSYQLISKEVVYIFVVKPEVIILVSCYRNEFTPGGWRKYKIPKEIFIKHQEDCP